jgi:hypothetical protein
VASRPAETRELMWIANGYLQSADYLAVKMHEDDATNDPYHRRIPLYLCHHAVEVSYKAALIDRGLTCPPTHDLARLKAACVPLIPDTNFVVPDWLIDSRPRTENLFPDLPIIYFDNLHERARYTSDTKGRPLQPLPDVDLVDVIGDILKLRKSWFPLFHRLAY